MIALSSPGNAEPICDIDDRWDELVDGERLTIRGRIDESYERGGEGIYSYDIVDSCGEAFVEGYEPLECDGEITIAGEYNENATFELFGQLAIWVTQAICE